MENVLIEYKSVFKGKQNETVEYKAKGIVDGNRISFEAEGSHIEISYTDDSVTLINNDSRLVLKKFRTLNRYKTDYGDLIIYTKLTSLRVTSSSVGFVYELYDEELISSVYVMIKLNNF